MTARDLNMTRGIYKEIPYSFSDGKFWWKPYVRFTKSGYVLYRMNGYLQPFYVKAGNKERRLPHWWDKCYTDKVVSFVNELLSGKAVIATVNEGDFIKCTDCGIMALVPYGESCPLCHNEEHNSWAMENIDETDDETLMKMGFKVYSAD